MSTHRYATNNGQYTIWKILGIWLAAGAPMWLMGWVAYPALNSGLSQTEAGVLRTELFTLGLIWQFVFALIILFSEEGSIRLSTIRRRFWLNHPVSPRTGKPQKTLWWWIIPLILLSASLEVGLRSPLTNLWTGIFPFFAEPPGYNAAELFAPEMRSLWPGEWGLLGSFLILSLFNTFLGEEFLFRGVLLPKMEGVFGKRDWVANGVLFTVYHLHQPWGLLATLPADLVFAFSGKYFRSNWFPIILHSGQSVLLLILILGLVLGLV